MDTNLKISMLEVTINILKGEVENNADKDKLKATCAMCLMSLITISSSLGITQKEIYEHIDNLMKDKEDK